MSDRTDAFWERVQKVELTGCWVWRGYIARSRYGLWSYWENGKTVTVYAHRFMYEMLVGPIPEGAVLDHRCLNRSCLNPAHLDPISQGENVRRGAVGSKLNDGAAFQRNKTHCPAGHEYSGDNLYVRPDGSRACRACMRASQERSRARRPERPPIPRGRKAACKQGHAFTPENTRIAPTGQQVCRECERERVRRYRSEPRTPQLRSETCKYGHPFDEENTAISPGGDRSCRACSRERTRVHRAKKKVAEAA